MTDPLGSAPLVTIVIAAWNARDTILRAVDSALAQTVPVEVVVVDDGSTDDTLALARTRVEPGLRLTVLAQRANMGPSAARNRAIAESGAPWIAVLDADDRMLPDRMERLIAEAVRHGSDFMADDLWKLPEGAPETDKHPMIGGLTAPMPLSAAEFVASNLSSRHGGRREMGFLKPLMARAFLDRHGLSYDPDIRLGEDYVLYTQALLAGARFWLAPPAGYVAFVRTTSLSGSHPTRAHADLIRADRAMLARADLDVGVRRALEAHLMEQRKKWAWRRLIDAKRGSNLAAAARCFWAPPAVGIDLLRRLALAAGQRMRQPRRSG